VVFGPREASPIWPLHEHKTTESSPLHNTVQKSESKKAYKTSYGVSHCTIWFF
jgi:hypothetical protein